ncbi:MAG: redoxin family protein [Hyphomonadaceae bacterium]|nr:redoxin family protein [Hyphomonadaceae bacterium]
MPLSKTAQPVLVTRRAAALGVAFAASRPGHAAVPDDWREHPALRPWRATLRAPLPLEAPVTMDGRSMSLRAWLAARPAVLVLWATWCGPCLSEKRRQAQLAARLRAAGAAAQILALQVFDEAMPLQARATLSRLGAEGLTTARAGPAAERGFVAAFGPTQSSQRRTPLPALALVDSQGAALAGMVGAQPRSGAAGGDYWADGATLDFLMRFRG